MSFGFKPSVSLLDAATTITIGETGNYGKIRVWGSIGYVLAVFGFNGHRSLLLIPL